MGLIKKFSWIFLFPCFIHINQTKANSVGFFVYYVRKIPNENGALYNILNEPNYKGKFCIRKSNNIYSITIHPYKSIGGKDEKAYYELEDIVKESKNLYYKAYIEKERENILKL